MQNMDPPRSILARFLFHLGKQAGTRGCCRGRVLFCSLPRVISARTQTTSRSRLGTSQNPEERGNVQQKKNERSKNHRVRTSTTCGSAGINHTPGGTGCFRAPGCTLFLAPCFAATMSRGGAGGCVRTGGRLLWVCRWKSGKALSKH